MDLSAEVLISRASDEAWEPDPDVGGEMNVQYRRDTLEVGVRDRACIPPAPRPPGTSRHRSWTSTSFHDAQGGDAPRVPSLVRERFVRSTRCLCRPRPCRG